MTNNLPSGVRYILFWYNEGDTDKLHIMQKGVEASHAALKSANLWDWHNVIMLYFSTPTRKYTNLTMKTQSEITRDHQPLSLLSLSPAKLWRATLDSVYEIAADAVANLSPAGHQKRDLILRKLKRGSFTPYDAFRLYVSGVRQMKREENYADSLASSSTERLVAIQRGLSGGFYGFTDFPDTSKKWHAMSTAGTAPGERHTNLYRASTSGLANIAIAAVYVDR